MSPMTCAYFKR